MEAPTARQLRRLHQYVGLFFTPAILFFAFSGALQTLGLHENHNGGPPPPAWIRWMASVHKDQRLLQPKPDEAAPRPPRVDQGDDHAPPERRDEGPSPIPMKVFVVLLSAGLIVSSLLGVTIALTNRTLRKYNVIALALGVLVPLILLFF